LNLKDSKGNQVLIQRKEIWGNCTAVPQPSTKSISSRSVTWHRTVTLHSERQAFACIAALEGQEAGMKLPHVDTGQQGSPTLQTEGDLKSQQWGKSHTVSSSWQGLELYHSSCLFQRPLPQNYRCPVILSNFVLVMCPDVLPILLKSVEIT
jgi:hypothetical protein